MVTNNKKQELERDFKNTLSYFAEALQTFKEACKRFEKKGGELRAQIYEEELKDVKALIGKAISDGRYIERINDILFSVADLERLLSPPERIYVKVATTDISDGTTYKRDYTKDELVELLNGGNARGYKLINEDDIDACLKEMKKADEEWEERWRPIKLKKQRLYDFAKELLVGKTIADFGKFAVEAPENPSYAGQKYREYETIEHTIEDVVEIDCPPCWPDWGSPDGKQITIKCSEGIDYFLRTKGFNRTLIDLVRGEGVEMGGLPCHVVWVKEYKLCPLIYIAPADEYKWYGFDIDELIENMKIVLNQVSMKMSPENTYSYESNKKVEHMKLRWENEELKKKIKELENKNETEQ